MVRHSWPARKVCSVCLSSWSGTVLRSLPSSTSAHRARYDRQFLRSRSVLSVCLRWSRNRRTFSGSMQTARAPRALGAPANVPLWIALDERHLDERFPCAARVERCGISPAVAYPLDHDDGTALRGFVEVRPAIGAELRRVHSVAVDPARAAAELRTEDVPGECCHCKRSEDPRNCVVVASVWPRSSAGQSGGFLNRRPWVRVPPGPPPYFAISFGFSTSLGCASTNSCVESRDGLSRGGLLDVHVPPGRLDGEVSRERLDGTRRLPRRRARRWLARA